jgi:membrane fusion protein, multidrug efflux system
MSRRSLIGVAVLVLGAGALAWWMAGGREPSEAAPAAATAAPAVPVTSGKVEARDMPYFAEGLGTVQAFNAVTVRSRVDGQIMHVAFTEGQEVKAGDPLFTIDPRPFQAALEQAEANKQKDEAQLVSAQADLDRYQRLVNNGYQTRQAYDTQRALVAQIQAAIKADQAQIDAARLNLGYADIRAPISGRTGARLVDQGNLIHASDNTALVSITQVKPIYVSFTVPQDKLAEIRQGQAAAPLAVEALSSDNKKLIATGKLSLIDNQIDQATGTIHLKATFDNEGEALWPGEFVNVRLILAMHKDVPTVPARTVQQGPDGYFAYVIKPDLTVERRSVEVVGFQDGLALVSKGLTPGESVVVDGQYRLTDGTHVAATPAGQGQGQGQGK